MKVEQKLDEIGTIIWAQVWIQHYKITLTDFQGPCKKCIFVD